MEKGILSALAAGLRGIYEQEGPLVDRCRCMQARVSAAELITDGGGKVTGNADGERSSPRATFHRAIREDG